MAKNKKQHFIPKSYLSAWEDPDTPVGQDAYVWVYRKDGTFSRRKSPGNLFTETDMYTVRRPNGERDLYFERGLSQLERGIARLRIDFLEQGKQLAAVPRLKLAAFIAALQSRTRRFRDHHRRQWQEIVDMGDQMTKTMATKTPEERRRISGLSIQSKDTRSISIEDARKIALYPIQTVAPAAIEAQLPFLIQMRHILLSAPDDMEFITSDAPVVWYDPQSCQKPLMFRGPALSDPWLEITVPISPRQLLLILHPKPFANGIKDIEYRRATKDMVDELNRRTCFHADQEVVTCRQRFDDQWVVKLEG